MTKSFGTLTALGIGLLALGAHVGAEDAAAPVLSHWGGTWARNMVSSETKLPWEFDAGKRLPDSEQIDPASTRNVRWVVKLGSESYGNPVVGNGVVLVGTNNESPRDPRHKGDRGILMCLDEKTGALKWQLAVPKLASGRVNDWEMLGLTSSAVIEGDHVYIVTNRCEVLCLDIHGMAGGNHGPYKDEGQYMAGPGKPPMEPGALDADIVWRFDMMRELGVFPHNASSCAMIIVGDLLYTSTSNGQDWSHKNVPAPQAPTFIALNKNTGEFVAEDDAKIGPRIMHGNWSSPALATVNGKQQILFGAGDGFLYGFDPTPVKDAESTWLKTIWRCDCNPANYRLDADGKPIPYPSMGGPSEVIATPVFYSGKVYVGIGQDPEHGEGKGMFTCINPDGQGDVTQTHKVWTYPDIRRSISTVAIVNGMLFTADFSGNVYCLDVETGKPYWTHPTSSHIWGSGLAADGRYYIGAEDGNLYVFELGKTKKLLSTNKLGAPIYSTPVASNGVLYVATSTHLFALQELPAQASR